MKESDYRTLLSKARRRLNWYGCGALDGKEAHDFAMDSLMACGEVNPANLHNRMIDGLRRTLGRTGSRNEGRFQMLQLPDSLLAPQDARHEPVSEFLHGVNLTERQKFIASKLSEGMTQRAIGNLLGVSETRVGQICKQIRKAMLESGNWNRSYYDR